MDCGRHFDFPNGRIAKYWSFCSQNKGAWMHHETYAAKGEFGEFTLARGRRLRIYFATHHTCMSATQCVCTLEVLMHFISVSIRQWQYGQSVTD